MKTDREIDLTQPNLTSFDDAKSERDVCMIVELFIEAIFEEWEGCAQLTKQLPLFLINPNINYQKVSSTEKVMSQKLLFDYIREQFGTLHTMANKNFNLKVTLTV